MDAPCQRQFGCHSCQAVLVELQKALDKASEVIALIIEEHEEFTRDQVGKLKKGEY